MGSCASSQNGSHSRTNISNINHSNDHDVDDDDDEHSRSTSASDNDSDHDSDSATRSDDSDHGKPSNQAVKRRRRHRRNKSRHAHRKAVKAVEARMRSLIDQGELLESPLQNVVQSPQSSPRIPKNDQSPDPSFKPSVTSSSNHLNTLFGSTPTQPLGGLMFNARGSIISSNFPSHPLNSSTESSNPSSSQSSSQSSQPKLALSTQSLYPFDPESITVLLVDADQEVVQTVEEWMTSVRYSVISCQDGEEAVEVLLSAGAKQSNKQANKPTNNPSNATFPKPSSHQQMSPRDDEEKQSLDVCDIDMVITDWQVEYQGHKLLDWLMENPSMKHIPVLILCDEEITVQGFDRLMRRGAAELTRKPLLHHSFLHTVQSVVTSKIERQHNELLKSAGDAYKNDLAAFKQSVPSFAPLATPARSLYSMLNTLVLASPAHGGTPQSPPLTMAHIENVQSILISSSPQLHADIAAVADGLHLVLHPCSSWSDVYQMHEEIDASSQQAVVVHQNLTAAELSSPHWSSTGFAFPLSGTPSGISSPTSKSGPPRSQRPSFFMHNHFGSNSNQPHSMFPTSPLNTNANHLSVSTISPRGSSIMRSSFLKTFASFHSYFGVEFFIVEASMLNTEQGEQWREEMRQRPLPHQCPIMLCIPMDTFGSEASTKLIRSLHPLSVTPISYPFSHAHLQNQLTRMLENIALLRRQRMYAYRAQTYRMLLRKLRESRFMTSKNIRGSVSSEIGEEAKHQIQPAAVTALPSSHRVSQTAIPSSTSSSSTFVSRASCIHENTIGIPFLASRKASEVTLQPFSASAYAARIQHAADQRDRESQHSESSLSFSQDERDEDDEASLLVTVTTPAVMTTTLNSNHVGAQLSPDRDRSVSQVHSSSLSASPVMHSRSIHSLPSDKIHNTQKALMELAQLAI